MNTNPAIHTLENVGLTMFGLGIGYAQQMEASGENVQHLLAVQDVISQMPFGAIFAHGMRYALKDQYDIV